MLEEIEGTAMLDINTTGSYPDPSATLKGTDEETLELFRERAVQNAIYFPESSGTLI